MRVAWILCISRKHWSCLCVIINADPSLSLKHQCSPFYANIIPKIGACQRITSIVHIKMYVSFCIQITWFKDNCSDSDLILYVIDQSVADEGRGNTNIVYLFVKWNNLDAVVSCFPCIPHFMYLFSCMFQLCLCLFSFPVHNKPNCCAWLLWSILCLTACNTLSTQSNWMNPNLTITQTTGFYQYAWNFCQP